jgi:hypothetical protein
MVHWSTWRITHTMVWVIATPHLTKSRFEMNSYSTQVAQLQFEYIWIRQSIMSEIVMLYQSILNLRISHVGKSHKRQSSAIAILLNKCDHNYS